MENNIKISCYWMTENAPLLEKTRSFRRYLMTTVGPIAYIEPYNIRFEKYDNCFDKDGAKFTWMVTWLVGGSRNVDGTAYGNRRLKDVENIVLEIFNNQD